MKKTEKLNAPIRYFGGKGVMRERIIEHFPDLNEIETYVEPFGGSFSVGFKKPIIANEIYNDLEKNVYSLYKVLSDKELFTEFKHRCDLQLFCEDFRDEYREMLKTELSLLERAYLYYMVNRMSYNGIGGFTANLVVRRGMAKSVSDFLSSIEKLPEIHQRLSRVIIMNTDGIELIKRYDKSDVLHYCFSNDTEVLTKNGWKLLKNCDMDNDLFLSREPNTHKLEWVKAVDFIQFHHKGKMFEYKGKEIDLLVTPNHRLFVEKYNSKKEEVLESAKSLYNKRFKFISAGGKWDGHNNKTIIINGLSYDLKEFAYLFGIWATDGSYNNLKTVTITQNKIDVRKKIEETLIKLNIPYSILSDGAFYLKREFSSFFDEYGKKMNRFIPSIIKDSSPDIILKCLEGIIDGDGDNSNETKNGLFGSRRISICKNYKMLSDIQEMLYKVGFASSYKIRKSGNKFLKSENRLIKGDEYFTISIKNKKVFEHSYKQFKNDSWVDYDDMVYCVTLEKFHTVLVRRNGKSIWCGQCDPPYAHSTRTNVRYAVDMDDELQNKFIDACISNKNAKILISGYNNELYGRLEDNGFSRVDFNVNTIGGNMKPKQKIESLWKNY